MDTTTCDVTRGRFPKRLVAANHTTPGGCQGTMKRSAACSTHPTEQVRPWMDVGRYGTAGSLRRRVYVVVVFLKELLHLGQMSLLCIDKKHTTVVDNQPILMYAYIRLLSSRVSQSTVQSYLNTLQSSKIMKGKCSPHRQSCLYSHQAEESIREHLCSLVTGWPQTQELTLGNARNS